MPRNMSFALTTEQFKNKTKTVTRRLGWKFLKPGDVVMGCRKCMGLEPGEKIERLGLIRIVSVRREPLENITFKEVIKEGFENHPGVLGSPMCFVDFFCSHTGCTPKTKVTRIEFEYI